MLRKIAAVPPDVRKGSAFPVTIEKISGGCAARVEAQPQQSFKNLTERHSLSAHRRAQPEKPFLPNIS